MESIVQFAVQKLTDFVTQEADLLLGVDEQIISLRTKLEWMRAFLKNAHRMRIENELFKLWVSQIREVAYDAEDVIDSYIFNIEQKRREDTSAGFMRCLTSFAGCIKDVPAIHDVGKKILNIEKRLGDIKEIISQYDVGNILVGGEASSSSNQSQLRREKMAPIVEEADVVGFEDETKTLVLQLTEGDARRAVISIAGMGGLEEWRVEEGAMRNLRRLVIRNCKKLKMLPNGLRHIRTLQDLQLSHMPEEFRERVRKDDGEDWFKVRHVPALTINP